MAGFEVTTEDLSACWLDPIRTLMAKLWRTGLWLDPGWTLVSTLVIRLLSHAVASPFKQPDQNMLLRQDLKIAV